MATYVKMKPRPYPSPCDTCTREECLGKDCEPWRIRYLYRQKQINAYAKLHGLTLSNERSEIDEQIEPESKSSQ